MKKMLLSFTIIVCMLLMLQPISASEDIVEISFKVGDDTLNINGKSVTVETPFVQNGTTLVPIRVITEAFGALVTWNESDQSVLIETDGTDIQIFINNKIAVINGTGVTMLEAPIIQNDTTMVPLRFITENLGATVSYTDETKEITVLKTPSDYTAKIGDSYYGWTMDNPVNAYVSYQSDDGSNTYFEAIDYSYNIDIYFWEHDGSSLDQLLIDDIRQSYSSSVLDYGVETVDDLSFAKFSYIDYDSAYEDRIYINGNQVCYIYLTVYDSSEYETNPFYDNLLDSFRLDYVEGSDIENLSIIVDDEYNIYRDSYFGYSFNYPNTWWETTFYVSDYAGDNKIGFESYDYQTDATESIIFEVFSLEDDLDLSTWYEDELILRQATYNPSLYSIVEEEDLIINDLHAKKLVAKIQYPENDLYIIDVFLVKGDYRYQFSYVTTDDNYMLRSYKDQIKKMYNSIVITRPSDSNEGLYIDMKKMLFEENMTSTFVDENGYWTFELPTTWYENDYYYSTDSASFINNDNNIYLDIITTALEDLTLTDMINDYKSEMLVTINDYEYEYEYTESIITEDETVIYEMVYDVVTEENHVFLTSYMFENNGIAYQYNYTYLDINATEYNLNLLDSMWNSFQVQ